MITSLVNKTTVAARRSLATRNSSANADMEAIQKLREQEEGKAKRRHKRSKELDVESRRPRTSPQVERVTEEDENEDNASQSAGSRSTFSVLSEEPEVEIKPFMARYPPAITFCVPLGLYIFLSTVFTIFEACTCINAIRKRSDELLVHMIVDMALDIAIGLVTGIMMALGLGLPRCRKYCYWATGVFLLGAANALAWAIYYHTNTLPNDKKRAYIPAAVKYNASIEQIILVVFRLWSAWIAFAFSYDLKNEIESRMRKEEQVLTWWKGDENPILAESNPLLVKTETKATAVKDEQKALKRQAQREEHRRREKQGRHSA